MRCQASTSADRATPRAGFPGLRKTRTSWEGACWSTSTVDLGPEGGKDGGAIVAEGTPETIAAHHATSHTGRYLKERLAEPPDRTAAAIRSAMASLPDARRR